MRAIFSSYEDMLREANKLVEEDEFDAQDRAAIQSFYNGRETMSRSEAETQGVENITNHLFGFDSLDLSRRQIESVYTKSTTIFEFEFHKADMRVRDEWERRVAIDLDRIIKKSRRFKPEWKSLAGELTLFGRGVFVFRDNEDWCPVIGRPFTPRGTGILPNQVPYCVVPDYMTVKDLYDALASSQRRNEMGIESYWREADLKTLIATITGTLNQEPTLMTNYGLTSANAPADEIKETHQMGAAGDAGLRTRVPVFYFYIGNMDKKGCPFDLVILPRLSTAQIKSMHEKALAVPRALYDKPEYFECADCFLHPFFIDCELGGRTSWHRVMGLGRLNYDPDVELEEFFNEAMAGSRENIRRLYQVGSSADWEILKNWSSGNGPTNVLPPGVQLAEQNKSPNFQYAFQTIQMLSQLTRRNASSNSPLMGDGKAGELEINAIERQGRNAEALAARMGDVYECADTLGLEVFRRFLSDNALEGDRGYEEIKEFHKCLKEYGIPRAMLLRWVEQGEVVVKMSRSAGDGDTIRRRMANQMLMSRIQMFGSEAQQLILRRITAEETGDYDFAQQVVPYEQKDPPDQVERANDENDQCERLGIINIIPQLNDDDLDLVHVNYHFRGLQAWVARGNIRKWDQVDVAGFHALGGHCAAHIKKLLANPEMKQMGTQLMQQLQQLVTQGEEFANNLEKQQQANELTQKDQADIQLKQQKQALAERAQGSLEEHRNAALALSAHKQDINLEIVRQQMGMQGQQQKHSQMMEEENAVTAALQKRAEIGIKRAQMRAKASQAADKSPSLDTMDFPNPPEDVNEPTPNLGA